MKNIMKDIRSLLTLSLILVSAHLGAAVYSHSADSDKVTKSAGKIQPDIKYVLSGLIKREQLI